MAGAVGREIGMGLKMQDFVLPLVATGAVAACLSAFRGKIATTRRGRLCDLGWAAGLLALALVAMSASYPVLSRTNLGTWAALLFPLAAVLILVMRPRLARVIVPAALILLGLYGFLVVRNAGFSQYTGGTYGLTTVGAANMGLYLVLPQAYAFLLLGSWLAWRVTDRRSLPARLALGRLAHPERPSQLWAFLLVPVTMMVAALVSPNIWFGSGIAGICWTLAIIAGAVQIVRRSPDLAAGLAVTGLICLGVAGLYLAVGYGSGGWLFPLTSYGYILYGLVDVSSTSMADAAAVQALALIGAAVWLVPRAVPGAMRLLGRAADAELVSRVQSLTASRAVAVHDAAADLRRLERDLHDGAQARLVALGMNLRAVERLIPTSPDAALALVAEARETSARALAELRELVRGVHPPVLADRGLGDAIRALALDSPLRIESDISLPGRLPAPVETACYFAVAEVLTNAAKHSGARDARIAAERADGVLRISVTDFGVGGADPGKGTGLAGIERRLASFDGIVAVSSPVGGPTMVVIEVPCATTPAARSAG
jgi:signal transduction histidine kinase